MKVEMKSCPCSAWRASGHSGQRDESAIIPALMLRDLLEQLDDALAQFRVAAPALANESELNDLKGKLTGKKGGVIPGVMAMLGKLPPPLSR